MDGGKNMKVGFGNDGLNYVYGFCLCKVVFVKLIVNYWIDLIMNGINMKGDEVVVIMFDCFDKDEFVGECKNYNDSFMFEGWIDEDESKLEDYNCIVVECMVEIYLCLISLNFLKDGEENFDCLIESYRFIFLFYREVGDL